MIKKLNSQNLSNFQIVIHDVCVHRFKAKQMKINQCINYSICKQIMHVIILITQSLTNTYSETNCLPKCTGKIPNIIVDTAKYA